MIRPVFKHTKTNKEEKLNREALVSNIKSLIKIVAYKITKVRDN